jgi:hypothetical protein
MYIYDRKCSDAQSLLKRQSITSRPAQRNSYYPDRVKRVFGTARSYVWANEGLGQLSEILLRPQILGAPDKVAVGQRVELDLAKTPFAAMLDKVRWTIPGRFVRSYDGTVRDSKLFELTNADLERPKISFFWVDAADGRTVRARIRTTFGAPIELVAVFDVKGPRMNHFTGQTNITRIEIEKRRGRIGMRLGNLSDARGIQWKWMITMPPNHAGHIKDVQTVLIDRSQIQSLRPGGKETRKLVWRHPSKTTPHVQLDDPDNLAAYSAGLLGLKIGAGDSYLAEGISDSPYIDLPPLAKTVSVNDQFTYYIMFKPATDKAQDAIWVPVAKAKWFWKATAMQRDKKWLPPRQPKPKMEPSIDKVTVDFPMYETNVFENEWQEVSRQPGPS